MGTGMQEARLSVGQLPQQSPDFQHRWPYDSLQVLTSHLVPHLGLRCGWPTATTEKVS